MVFHGSRSAYMVFLGSCSLVHLVCQFLAFFSWFPIGFLGFSWFFMVSG